MLIITVFVIATQRYRDLAKKLIEQFQSLDLGDISVEIIILTDDTSDFEFLADNSPTLILKPFKVPPVGWPDATLRRFEFMLSAMHLVSGSILVYLDADMDVSSSLNLKDFEEEIQRSANDLVFVAHPGYFNRSMFVNKFARSRFGPWEDNSESLAFVKKADRKTYVCGGIFWGTKDGFLLLCQKLSQNIADDADRKLIAKHHDESHLNWWLTKFGAHVVTPEWAHNRSYRHLEHLLPRISVVDKGDSFTRTDSNGNRVRLTISQKLGKVLRRIQSMIVN